MNTKGVLPLMMCATLLCSVSSAANAKTDIVDTAKIAQILKSEHRSKEHQKRDDNRHPIDVLRFFEISPTDTVLEVWPGNGWYSEILAPYLKEDGRLIAATFSVNNQNSKDKRKAFWSKIALEYRDKMADTAIYGDVEFTEFDPPQTLNIANANSIDKALIIRSLHIWDETGDLLTAMQSIYEAVKPGGTLGIVQHRADSFSSISSSAGEGYLTQSYVIEAAEKAGFTLLEKSEVNANPADTKDHPRGVYTLPPTLAMGALDLEKYQNIGESDRMTLKFIKEIITERKL